jgi:hypothetical protein
MAADAAPVIDLAAMGDPFVGARHRDDRGLEPLRLEHVAPLAPVHAELLQIGDEPLELLGGRGEMHRLAGELFVRRDDQRELALGLLRHEEEAVGVGREFHLLLAAEVEQPLGIRRLLQGAAAGAIVDDLDRGAGCVEQPDEARHDRIRSQHARIPEMREMPLVAVFESDAGEVGTDAPRREQMRRIEGVLAGLADRAPAPRLAGDRPDELGVAVPAALADVDGAAELLLVVVVGRFAHHPFELAEIGADDRGDLGRARFRLDERQDALGDDGEEEEADAGDQRDETGGHSAPPAAGTGRCG